MARKAVRRKPVRVSARRLGRTGIRIIGNPAGSYIDAHGDDPPYHDQHSDGGTYYDHPDSEHNDFHYDESGRNDIFKGDPAELVTDAIARLEGMLSKFEAVHRARLQTIATEMSDRLKQIEARVSQVESTAKRRR
jgi:hypothetical protein